MRSSRREVMPSLVNTLPRCHSTVRALRNSCGPDLGVGATLAARRAICASCGVSSAWVSRSACDRLAGGQQLARGAVGEGLGAHRGEQLVRGAELLPRVDPPALAAQPLAVEQVGAGEVVRSGCRPAGRSPRGTGSAASPVLSSARDRRSMPRAQSVGLAAVVAASRANARRRRRAGRAAAASTSSWSVRCRGPRGRARVGLPGGDEGPVVAPRPLWRATRPHSASSTACPAPGATACSTTASMTASPRASPPRQAARQPRRRARTGCPVASRPLCLVDEQDAAARGRHAKMAISPRGCEREREQP